MALNEPLSGLEKISTIHEQRLALLYNILDIQDLDQDVTMAVHDVFAKAAVQLTQIFYRPGVKSDPGKVTAALDKILEAKMTAMSALTLPLTKPLPKKSLIEDDRVD